MKTKSDVIATVDPTKTYLGSYVIARINEVDLDDRYIPEKLKKGDVIVLQNGVKRRPCVVIKVHSDKVLVIPLTSTENIHNLCSCESRFFGKGWFSNVYNVVELEHAKRAFVGIFDNPKALNCAIKELKNFINKNI